MPRNRNKKRKANNDPHHPNHNNNKKGLTDWSHTTPSQIQADPKIYIQIPKTLKCQPPYAAAVLLGLANYDSIDQRSLQRRSDLVEWVEKNCGDVMARDATLIRKLLDTGDETFLIKMSRSPLISHVTWDLDLAMLAIQKTSMFVRSVAKKNPGLLSEATVFRQLLDRNDVKFLKTLSLATSLLRHVTWDLDLAMLAVGKAPTFYTSFPTTLKANNTMLALAAMMPSDETVAAKGKAMIQIVKDVHRHCPCIFSNDNDSHTALAKVLDSDNEELVDAILVIFGDQIGWNADLVEIALDSFPSSYSFLPAEFRNDNVDAQQVMALLLKPNVTDKKVDKAIAAFPGFFADRDAVKQLFEKSSNTVVERVVAKMSPKLPWDKDLMRLAADLCHDGDYHEDPNMADEEMERMYKRNKKCKFHLPLGMLVSYIMADVVDEWPDFLNHCPCPLVHDESSLKEALDFVELLLQKSDLSTKLTSWLQGIVRPIKEKLQNHEAFQTLLKCITVADGGEGALELLRGDGDTSIALKRHIAEFLGAPIEPKATLKRNAVKLVYCILTLPGEFREEIDSPSDVLDYESPYRPGDDTFYCEWCCKALAKLNDQDKGNMDDDEGDSEDESEGDSEDESEGDSEDESEGDSEDESEGDSEDKSEGDGDSD